MLESWIGVVLRNGRRSRVERKAVEDQGNVDDQVHASSLLGKVKAASRDAFNKQEIATCSYKDRRPTSGLLPEMGNSNGSSRDKKESEKRAQEEARESGKQCAEKLVGEEKTLGDSNDNVKVAKELSSRSHHFSDGISSSLGLTSQVPPPSCPLSFHLERDSEDLRLGVDLSCRKERFCGLTSHSKPASSRIFDQEIRQEKNTHSKRFSFSFGRLSRSHTFKEDSSAGGQPLTSMRCDGSACPPQSSKHCGSSRVSPLRRLLDPLLKSKGSENFHHNNNGDTRLYDKSKIPQGWLECPGFGLEIGCIIPSKVPLSESYNEHVPPGKRYSFKQVIRNQRISGRKLGLVIDLTNTTRYYSTLDLKKDGIKHVKIACRGRDAVPDNVSVNSFVNEAIQFIVNQKHPKKYILVHCTHGHNRTGFMIVHYLMRSMPTMNVTQALKMFSDARPPGIYKPDYIDALYTFYHEIKPETATCPPTPEWKRSTELDLNGDAVHQDDGDGDDDDDAQPAPVQEISQEIVTMSNDDILGDEIPHYQEEAYRKFCYKMLMMSIGGRGCAQFPGSHPVSLDRESLQLLRQRYYYATWKADGTRYMMLLTIDGCYLIDRSFKFRRVQMRFPCRHSSGGMPDQVHHFTLLDGEMVIDNPMNEKGQARRRYLVYDLVAINGESVVERTFCERWNMVVHEVIKGRDVDKQRNHCYRYDLEPFGVRMKGFYLLSTVEKLLKGTIPSLSHEADGLIFQGWDDPYVPRTHKGLLKWKYAEMNSVDFLFEMGEEDEGCRMLFLFERGKKKLMDGYTVEFRDGSDPSSYNGKIVECSWDKEKKVWVSMRIRVDKTTPNDINTARKVIKSINDNITEEVLLQEIREIIRLPMYADRIRMDLRAAGR
ncbi:unnamed protein product [Brassica oleracea var. botrytis]